MVQCKQELGFKRFPAFKVKIKQTFCTKNVLHGILTAPTKPLSHLVLDLLFAYNRMDAWSLV